MRFLLVDRPDHTTSIQQDKSRHLPPLLRNGIGADIHADVPSLIYQILLTVSCRHLLYATSPRFSLFGYSPFPHTFMSADPHSCGT